MSIYFLYLQCIIYLSVFPIFLVRVLYRSAAPCTTFWHELSVSLSTFCFLLLTRLLCVHIKMKEFTKRALDFFFQIWVPNSCFQFEGNQVRSFNSDWFSLLLFLKILGWKGTLIKVVDFTKCPQMLIVLVKMPQGSN